MKPSVTSCRGVSLTPAIEKRRPSITLRANVVQSATNCEPFQATRGPRCMSAADAPSGVRKSARRFRCGAATP